MLMSNKLGLVADALLFLSGLLLLVDLAPRDLLPKASHQKRALQKLREGRNLIFSPPPLTTIEPSSQDMKLVVDPDSARILVDLIRDRSILAYTVPWDRAVGVGYSTLSLPVGRLNLDGFHPLYIAVMPIGDSSPLELIPVGQLEDIDRWLSAWHQSSVTVTAAIFLTAGFLLQLILRLVYS
jgi:hypothetical protein